MKSRALRRLAAIAAGPALAILLTGVVMAAPTNSVLPPDMSTPINVQNNGFIKAIFAVLSTILPLLGGLVMAAGIWGIVEAAWHAIRGEEVRGRGTIIASMGGQSAFVHRLAEILIGLIIVALSLSGQWANLVNALYNATVSILNAFINGLNGGQI
ncbi:MAG: hypothetical protein QJR08_00295 [Bacillota bacterium]|nr:hypothetical protein [Bacillota bacterium]